MAIVFKKIPGLKIKGFNLADWKEKVSPNKSDLIEIALDLESNQKIPASFRELLKRVGNATDKIRDEFCGIELNEDEMDDIVQNGIHFGRCSISPLTNPGECTHEVLITMVVSGKSEVLLLNV